jgi:hypothetical protein
MDRPLAGTSQVTWLSGQQMVQEGTAATQTEWLPACTGMLRVVSLVSPAGIALTVERFLGKEEDLGSNPSVSLNRPLGWLLVRTAHISAPMVLAETHRFRNPKIPVRLWMGAWKGYWCSGNTTASKPVDRGSIPR